MVPNYWVGVEGRAGSGVASLHVSRGRRPCFVRECASKEFPLAAEIQLESCRAFGHTK